MIIIIVVEVSISSKYNIITYPHKIIIFSRNQEVTR